MKLIVRKLNIFKERVIENGDEKYRNLLKTAYIQ